MAKKQLFSKQITLMPRSHGKFSIFVKWTWPLCRYGTVHCQFQVKQTPFTHSQIRTEKKDVKAKKNKVMENQTNSCERKIYFRV